MTSDKVIQVPPPFSSPHLLCRQLGTCTPWCLAREQITFPPRCHPWKKVTGKREAREGRRMQNIQAHPWGETEHGLHGMGNLYAHCFGPDGPVDALGISERASSFNYTEGLGTQPPRRVGAISLCKCGRQQRYTFPTLENEPLTRILVSVN